LLTVDWKLMVKQIQLSGGVNSETDNLFEFLGSAIKEKALANSKIKLKKTWFVPADKPRFTYTANFI